MSVLEPSALTQLPPSYSQPFANDEGAVSSNEDSFPALLPDNLPAYTPAMRSTTASTFLDTRRSAPKEFYYDLKRRGKIFASLTIMAEGTYSKHMPTFVEGKPIKGSVKLSFDKPDALQSVIITVRGQVITGPNRGEQMTFMDISHNMWSITDGEPLTVRSNNSGGNPSPASQGSKFNGKLQGDYMWPFSVDLPKDVVLGGRTFNLPETFQERHARASITYEMCLTLARGKFRPDHRIATSFGYIPLSRPPPLPPLRSLAYEEGVSLLGPTIDPDGWVSSEPVLIRGKIFNLRTFQVKSTLFLAKPLSYTRGSVVPLCLRLESSDEQALDLLSLPKAIVLRLERRIRYFSKGEHALESLVWKDGIDRSQPAVWWPSTEGSERFVRYVNGELHLKADFKPTSAMAQFRIEYSVILFPFDAPGVTLLDSRPLLQQSIDIVTTFAPGPRPRIAAPPGYESEAPALTPTNMISTAGIGLL